MAVTGDSMQSATYRRDETVDHPRPVDDAAHAQDRHLGVVDDRGGTVDAEHAVVVDGEGTAGQVGGRQGPAARRRS